MKTIKFLLFLSFLFFTATSASAWPVPGTGQTACYSATAEIPCPSSGEAFYGQDAQHPSAGRSYAKLGQSGVVLSASATQADGWIMTRDNVTGLVWELKTQDGTLHDRTKAFSWCNRNALTNGGGEGTCGEGGTDTESLIGALNEAQFGGFNDWRMPTLKELFSLVHCGGLETGAVDAEAFPNMFPSNYWSSTPDVSDPEHAWYAGFSVGTATENLKSLQRYAVAVRSGQTEPVAALVQNGDGTVTDPNTGLMWQEATTPDDYAWEQALAYVAQTRVGGYADWRLPDLQELFSLIDHARVDPAIDALLAAKTFPGWHWTSTTNPFAPDRAYVVSFMDGSAGTYKKTNPYRVRAVRSLQTVDPVLSVVPASHDFGDATVGANGPVRTFTMTNTGGGSLVLGALRLSGACPSDFALQNDGCSGRSLSASAYCTVEVLFKPESEGQKNASLAVPWGGLEAVKGLTGRGVAASVLPGDVNGDGHVDLADLIAVFQVVVGKNPVGLHLDADVDDDGKLGMQEAHYLLGVLAKTGDTGDGSLIASHVVPAGGMSLVAGPLLIDIPEGAFDEPTTLQIYQGLADTGLDDDLFRGVGSPFRLEFASPPRRPITLAFSIDQTGFEGDPAGLRISSIEKIWMPSANAVVTSRSPLETIIDSSAGTAKAVVDFTAALDEPVPLSALSDARSAQTDGGGFDFTVHLTVFSGVYAESTNGLFRLWYNPGVTSNAYLQKVVTDLTASKTLLEGYGLSFARRTRWPFDVYIKDLGSSVLGQFAPSARGVNYSFLNVNKDESISDTDLRAICGHEFFHFLQSLYDPRSAYMVAVAQGPYYWLYEASSVWFMAKIVGNPDYVPDLFIADSGFINEPLETNTESHGYGASGLLTYLTDKYGNGIMKEIWEKVSRQTIGSRGATGALASVVANYGVLEDDWLDFAEKFITGALPGHANWPLPPLSGGTWKVTPEDTAKKYDLSLTQMQAWHNMVGVTWGEAIPENAALTIRHPVGAPYEMKVRIFTQTASSAPWVHHADLAAGGETTVAGFDLYPQKRVKVAVMNASASASPGYFNAMASTSVELKFSVPQPYSFNVADLWLSYNARFCGKSGCYDHSDDYGPSDFWMTETSKNGVFNGYTWSSSWDRTDTDFHQWGSKTFTLNKEGDMITSFNATQYTEDHGWTETLIVTGSNIPRTGSMRFEVKGPDACNHFEIRQEGKDAEGNAWERIRTGCSDPDSEISIWFYNKP